MFLSADTRSGKGTAKRILNGQLSEHTKLLMHHHEGTKEEGQRRLHRKPLVFRITIRIQSLKVVIVFHIFQIETPWKILLLSKTSTKTLIQQSVLPQKQLIETMTLLPTLRQEIYIAVWLVDFRAKLPVVLGNYPRKQIALSRSVPCPSPIFCPTVC